MFSLPTNAAGFTMPAMPTFDAFGRNVAVLDDVKSKAQRAWMLSLAGNSLMIIIVHC